MCADRGPSNFLEHRPIFSNTGPKAGQFRRVRAKRALSFDKFDRHRPLQHGIEKFNFERFGAEFDRG